MAKNVKLIMLVGLPGSGKSTFTKLLCTSTRQVGVINQDELGRKKCEEIFLREIKKNELTVLDRCNLAAASRKEWLALSLLNKSEILCVYLATDVDECIHRAKNRKNHPTIKHGGGERIITEAYKKMEPPNEAEGFSEVVILYDEEDVRTYLKSWDCAQIEPEEDEHEDDESKKFHKFPRTQHLINLGGATRDDLLITKKELATYFQSGDSVDICEKVDGAQMGFSMDDNYLISVQNRSHYVNSKSHKQFKDLDRWLNRFSGDLYEILQDSNHILFGEWLFAKHSVQYDSLPNYFLAFDLYNKKEKSFYARDVLEARLNGTEIMPVRLIYSSLQDDGSKENTFVVKNEQDVLKLLEQKSQYGSEQIEGLYIKINENGLVKSRSKVVRADFIVGNDHWSKGIMTPNRLTNYFF